jgi:uncharacterized hydrophobic protein (TIGR00341 family)
MDQSPDPYDGHSGPPQVNLLKELLELAPRADILDTQIIILTVLSGLVALGGLFLNSVAVIIGAMVISPLLEPIYAGSVYLANGSMKKFLRHVKVMGVLVIALIASTVLVTAVLTLFTTLPVTPEILSRLENQELSAVLAILLGITAIFARKRGFVAAVIGVGISVALVPPVVVTGIVAVLQPGQILNALSLSLNNIFGLFAGMLIAILFLGVGPPDASEFNLSRVNIYLTLICIAGLLLLVFFILLVLRHVI